MFIFRDIRGVVTTYEAIAIIEFAGNVESARGDSRGHYTCDIKDKSSGGWFRTNDNAIPKTIKSKDVSNLPYVVLYRKVSYQ